MPDVNITITANGVEQNPSAMDINVLEASRADEINISSVRSNLNLGILRKEIGKIVFQKEINLDVVRKEINIIVVRNT